MTIRTIVFRNNDRYAIKRLLMDIGEFSLEQHCWNRKLNKPRKINLFFLEANDSCTMLKYNYPLKGVAGIMEVDKYDLPECGWIRVMVQ